MNTTNERVHHPYSPSKLQPLEACPCYDSAFTDSEAAQTGTMQHDVAESGVDNARLADFKAMAVVECMKIVDEYAAEMGPGVIRIKEEYLPIDDVIVRAKVNRTEKVDGKTMTHSVWQGFKGTTAGYLDVGLVSADKKRARVVDFKFGMWEVEPAPNNVQGISYMLGLAKRFPELEECTVYFFMPHRDQISFHTFHRSEFAALHLRIKTIVNRAIEVNKVDEDDVDKFFAPANPNVGSCLFCSRLGRCTKVTALALKVGKKYAPLVMPESISTSVFTDPADAGKGIKFAQIIKAWAEAYRTQSTAKAIDDPKFMPVGFKIVTGSKRSVVAAKALGEFAKTYLPVEFHSKVEALYDIAIGNLEKLISTAAPRGSKEATVDLFGEKALAAGLLKQGDPYAFLKQDNAKSE